MEGRARSSSSSSSAVWEGVEEGGCGWNHIRRSDMLRRCVVWSRVNIRCVSV